MCNKQSLVGTETPPYSTQGAEPTITLDKMPYEKTIRTVRDELITTFRALDAWFEKPADGCAYRPRDGGWAIEEMLEHITLVNHFLMIVIRKGCEKCLDRALTQPIKEVESDLNRIAFQNVADPDAFQWNRPEHMESTETKALSEVRSLMQAQVQECLAMLARMSRGGRLASYRLDVRSGTWQD